MSYVICFVSGVVVGLLVMVLSRWWRQRRREQALLRDMPPWEIGPVVYPEADLTQMHEVIARGQGNSASFLGGGGLP